eukprot:5645860-Amphidinium_carterae.1
MQGGRSTEEGDARRAGAQTKTCLLFGGRSQAAPCCGQGYTGPANAVANGSSGCATAKTRNSRFRTEEHIC